MALIIPPHTEVEVLLKTSITSDLTVIIWLVEPVAGERPVGVARALMNPENASTCTAAEQVGSNRTQ